MYNEKYKKYTSNREVGKAINTGIDKLVIVSKSRNNIGGNRNGSNKCTKEVLWL